ncbi:MAG: hypothetical protein JSV38_15070 [Desulfobacterales bacterium]|nr:MAG: hypothetical protein JSV38_15070 [Desulfobacterales bacterium]
MKSTLQQAAGNLPGKEFCNFYIRSLTPQQATGNALAVVGTKGRKEERQGQINDSAFVY